MNGNFKVRCVKGFNIGDIDKDITYSVVNGKLIDGKGVKRPLNGDTFNSIVEINKCWSGVLFELVEESKPTLGESITIRRKKSKVIATLSIDGEFKYSQYIKLVDANGDFKTAVKMVVERLMDKWKGEDGVDLTASTFDWDGFKQGKFAVHCDTEEKARGFLNECDANGITWITGHRTTRQDTRWDIYEKETCYGFSDGDMRGICYGHFEETEKIDYTPTITPSTTIKKVKRPAKVGEWVEILRVDSFTEDDHKVGNIFQAIKCTRGNSTDSAYYENKEDSCGYVDFGDYLVLENYTPEVVAPIVETPKFVKANVGDWVRITNGERHKATVGAVYKVESLDGQRFINVKIGSGSMQLISNEQFEIVEAPPINPLSSFTQEQLMKELFNRQGL